MRLRAEVPAETVVFVGLDDSTPAPGVIEAITDADLVVLAAVQPRGLGRDHPRRAPGSARRSRPPRAPVVGLSPIVGGAHVRGMAEQMLASIGVEVSAAGVGLHYGARTDRGVLDGWLVDDADADDVGRVEAAGIACSPYP